MSRSTGVVYWYSSVAELGELPDDIEEGDDYLPLPDKAELGLGRTLALNFVAQHSPDHREDVFEFFRGPGAYSRFKGLLDRLGLLSSWYEYEELAIDEALKEWCYDNDLEFE